jgi:hypothetical protein
MNTHDRHDEHDTAMPTQEAPLSRRQLLRRSATAGAGVAGVALLGPAALTYGALPQATPADQLSKAMRKLWEEHITWTRLYLVSFAAGLPDTALTAQRLLRNQVDIGDALKPFYGVAAGNRLTALLKQHILGAAALVAAAKAGKTSQVQRAKRAWYANADAIALFLHGANPEHWPLAQVAQMMHKHLDLTLEEALARLQGQYAADIAAFDRVQAEILQMADALTAGIIAQFPQRFHSQA